MIYHKNILQAPHIYLLWWSTLLSICSLVPITGVLNGFLGVLAFFVVSRWAPQRWWSPLGRGALFGVLLAFVFIFSGDVSREMGTSLLMMTMVVKYAEMKTFRDGNMIVLFNSVAPFVAFLQDQTPLVFLLGLLALVFTLSASRSLTEVVSHKKPVRKQSMITVSSVMLNILLLIPLAASAYMFIPRLDNPLWSGYSQQRAKTGVGEEMNVAQWTSLFNDLSTAFRVRFDGAAPPPKDMYFRGITLWSFDGQVWRTQPLHPEVSASTNIPLGDDSATPSFTYTITSEIKNTSRAFVLDVPTILPEGVTSTNDNQFYFEGNNQRKPVRWTSAPEKTSALTNEQRSSALQLPANSNMKTVEFARQWRQRTNSDAQFVSEVVAFFQGEFEYSLSPPAVRPDYAVDDFVFQTKTGFCQHFSSAFAMMTRAAGIPTRVVNGYAGFEQSEMGDYFRIRQADAHAWAEVWIDDRWHRVDPTAATTGTRTRTDFRFMFFDRSHEMFDWIKDIWDRWVVYYDQNSQEQMSENIKNFVTSATSNDNLQKVIAGVVVLLLTIMLCVYGWNHVRLMKDPQKLSRFINKWFAQWGVSWDAGTDWTQKEQKIAHLLTDEQKLNLHHALQQARQYLYAGEKISPSKIQRLFKKIKKQPLS